MTTLTTADDAHAWGLQFAPTLSAGDVIALCGNLGAGKTQITRGIVAGMESKAAVTSPTFTLVHEYLDGRLPVFHFDFYRMENAAEVIGIGWDEFLTEPGVIIVEWADMFPDLMPPNTRWFHIEALPDGSRRVTEGAAHEMTGTLLALDLSTAHGSIAVVRGDDVLFESVFQSERSHNAQVFAPLREALKAAGDDLAGIVIGNGPGSYTGVRIAIAAAQGIALSRNVWCVGWSSLTAPDIEAAASYSVIGDARRQSFYLARVENGRLMPCIETVSPESARERVSSGNWLTFDPKPPLDLPHVRSAKPSAVRLAENIQTLSQTELDELIQQPLIPHYLAEAFITLSKRPFSTTQR